MFISKTRVIEILTRLYMLEYELNLLKEGTRKDCLELRKNFEGLLKISNLERNYAPEKSILSKRRNRGKLYG